MNIIPPSFNFSKNNSDVVISGTSFSGTSFTEPKTKNIEDNIKVLKDKGDSMISELNQEELECLDEIINSIKSNKDNDKIKKLIKDNFKKESYLSGTVAAVFMDCSKSKHGGCSLTCSGSAAKVGKNTCSDLVLAHEDNKLLKLNNIDYTPHCYIYMKDTKVLNESNINKLKSSGVNNVTFIFNDKTETKINLVKSEKNPMFSIFIFLIFVIIMIALVYIIYLNRNKFMAPKSVTWGNVFI